MILMNLDKKKVLGIIIVIFFLLFIYLYKNKKTISEKFDGKCDDDNGPQFAITSKGSPSVTNRSSIIFDLYTYLDYLKKAATQSKFDDLVDEVTFSNGVIKVNSNSKIKYIDLDSPNTQMDEDLHFMIPDENNKYENKYYIKEIYNEYSCEEQGDNKPCPTPSDAEDPINLESYFQGLILGHGSVSEYSKDNVRIHIYILSDKGNQRKQFNNLFQLEQLADGNEYTLQTLQNDNVLGDHFTPNTIDVFENITYEYSGENFEGNNYFYHIKIDLDNSQFKIYNEGPGFMSISNFNNRNLKVLLKKDLITKAYISISKVGDDGYTDYDAFQKDLDKLKNEYKDGEKYINYFDKENKKYVKANSSLSFKDHYIDLKNLSDFECSQKDIIEQFEKEGKQYIKFNLLIEFTQPTSSGILFTFNNFFEINLNYEKTEIEDGELITIKFKLIKTDVVDKDITTDFISNPTDLYLKNGNFLIVNLIYDIDGKTISFGVNNIEGVDFYFTTGSSSSTDKKINLGGELKSLFIGSPTKDSCEIKIHRLFITPFDQRAGPDDFVHLIYRIPDEPQSISLIKTFSKTKTFFSVINMGGTCISYHMYKSEISENQYDFYKDFQKMKSFTKDKELLNNNDIKVFLDEIKNDLGKNTTNDFCNTYLINEMPEMSIYTFKMYNEIIPTLDLFKEYKTFCEEEIKLNICESILSKNEENNNLRLKFYDDIQKKSLIMKCGNVISDEGFQLFIKQNKSFYDKFTNNDLDSCDGKISKVKIIDNENIINELNDIVDNEISDIEVQNYFLNNQCKLGFIDTNQKEYIYDIEAENNLCPSNSPACEESETTLDENNPKFREIQTTDLNKKSCPFFPLLCYIYIDTDKYCINKIKIVKENTEKYSPLLNKQQNEICNKNKSSLVKINYLRLTFRIANGKEFNYEELKKELENKLGIIIFGYELIEGFNLEEKVIRFKINPIKYQKIIDNLNQLDIIFPNLILNKYLVIHSELTDDTGKILTQTIYENDGITDPSRLGTYSGYFGPGPGPTPDDENYYPESGGPGPGPTPDDESYYPESGGPGPGPTPDDESGDGSGGEDIELPEAQPNSGSGFNEAPFTGKYNIEEFKGNNVFEIELENQQGQCNAGAHTSNSGETGNLPAIGEEENDNGPSPSPGPTNKEGKEGPSPSPGPTDKEGPSPSPGHSDKSSNTPNEQVTGETTTNYSPDISTTSQNEVQNNDYLNKELLSILQSLSSGLVDRKNQQAVENKLHFLEKLLLLKEQNEGVNEETEFLKKLIVTSQLQMNNIVQKLSNQKSSSINIGKDSKYSQKPRIPNITQFKPSGTSNIFSPLIDIKTHDYNNNKKFSDAFEKGFEKGLKEGDKLSVTNAETQINDSSTTSGDQYINLGDTTNYERENTTIMQDGINFMGLEGGSKNEINMEDIDSGHFNKGNNESKGSTSQNGYLKGDNKGKIGIPGYSFLDPKFWNVPKRRNPVCHQENTDDRKPNSLDPAGYMHGGHSGVMEFHGVGSILPKFKYQENTKQIPDKLDRI